jgi:hypothetical protein
MERERGIEKGPPLPCPLLHKCVEEREIAEICKKLRCAPRPEMPAGLAKSAGFDTCCH